jgi:cell division protein FtsN
MTRDYKPNQKPAKSSSGGSPFLTGFLLGILIGVVGTVALTIYLRDSHMFAAPNAQTAEATKASSHSVSETEVTPNSVEGKTLQDPNKFDFYSILPETESKVTEQEVKNNTTIKQDSYFLQVGAFPNESDADNMKAKLALQGFESVVQSAEVPDKGIWHRVRIGPFTKVEQINKIRGDLLLNGFNADLIKVHTEANTD